MPFDLIRRIRWGNVAFAAAVFIVLARTLTPAFAATPLPRLPSDRAAPLIDDAAPIVALATQTPAPTPHRTKTSRPRPRRQHRAHRTKPAPRTSPRRATRPQVTATPTQSEPTAAASTAAEPIAPIRRPAPRASSPRRGEFGFEGG